MPGGGTLSPIELDFLWEAFAAGEAPYPLELLSHGATVGERARLRQETVQRLTARGLIDGAGEPHPLLGEHLDVLAHASVSVDSVALLDDDSVHKALACANDGQAVLAVQDESLTLTSIDPDGLVSAVTALLPSGARGTEKSVTVPMIGGKPAPQGDGDTMAFAEINAQQRLRGGQIAATVRDDDGMRARSTVLGWFDTATGRYMARSSVGADDTEWITVAPLDTATLRQLVAELVADARAQVGRVTT